MYVKLYRCLAIVAAGLALIFLLTPPLARADGGAPNLAYVAGAQNGVGIVDVGQQKMSGTLNIPGDPHMIALSLDGRFLYASQPALGRVAVIAAKTGDTICTASLPGKPTLVALDPNANVLFAAGNGAASVTSLDPTNCHVKRTFQTSGPVYGLAVATVASSLSATSGNQLWVANGDALTVFDDLSGKTLASVVVPGGPRYVTAPQGATIYVNTQQGGVFAVDLNSHKVTSLISGGAYGPMDYDATTGEVYVPDEQHNQLIVLSPVNAGIAPPKEPGRVIALNAHPRSIAITNDGQLGFVALEGGNVAMLDIPGRQVIATVKVGGDPQFIITGVYPPAIGTTPQQASTLGTIVNIAAYAIVIALLVVPIILFRRFAKARDTIRDEKETEDAAPDVVGEAERPRLP